MAKMKRIQLDPDIPAWHQQPGESNTRYKSFETYRRLGAARDFSDVAAEHGYTELYVQQLSSTGRWSDRIAAWERHQAEQYDQWYDQKAREAAERDMDQLDRSSQLVDTFLNHVDLERVAPEHMIRLLDVTLKHRRQLYGNPTDPERRASGTDQNQQTTLQVQVDHFAGLSEDGKLAALRDLTAQTQQWLEAADVDRDE